MITEKRIEVENLLELIDKITIMDKLQIDRHYAVMQMQTYAKTVFTEKEIFLLKLWYPQLQEYL